jgi:uncharacterized membrane protein YphA (DoxX/SURF4 family)
MSYDRLYYWMIVVLRYYVGITMLAYGSVKIVQLQFPSPTPWRLIEPYGDSSPFTLAWTFMGYSRGYNYFTGIAEVSCGILLLFKRTSLFGAVIAFTVSANIAAINFCFDVPVKDCGQRHGADGSCYFAKRPAPFPQLLLPEQNRRTGKLDPAPFSKTVEEYHADCG